LRPEDPTYSAQFLATQPEGFEQAMQKNIRRSAEKGVISIFVSVDGMTPQDKQKLSAYRVIADQMGYDIGQWKYSPSQGTGSASASIKAK